MTDVVIAGPSGRIEGKYHHQQNDKAPIILFFAPHPKHGGHLDNKVLYTAYHAFIRAGFSALRFNYRGVGKSVGTYDDGEAPLADATAALDWLQNINQQSRQCWVLGYSFGAWAALQLLMRRPEISHFVAIAPPANHYDFNFLSPCPSSGLVIHGLEDKIVPSAPVKDMVQKLNSQKDIKVHLDLITGANHNFSGQLEKVYQHLQLYIEKHL